MRDIIVIDLETSLHNKVGNFKASPHSPDNWAVWAGAVSLGTDLAPKARPMLVKSPTKEDVSLPFLGGSPDNTLLVGHNIGFDIKYLCGKNNKARQDWIDFINDDNSLIWDTQIAEYRLSGQSVISPSLDLCCEVRSWVTKPGRLKEYWQNGISTEDIPDDEVRPYLKHDLWSTAELFRDQLEQATSMGIIELLRVEMRSRLTTIVMEHNGMCFDDVAARTELEVMLEPELAALSVETDAAAASLFGLRSMQVRTNSSSWMKTCLYGGPLKWREQQPIMDEHGNPILFKTGKRAGQIKTKWHDMVCVMPRIAPMKAGTVDEEQLRKIMMHAKCTPDLRGFLDLVLRRRNLAKQAKTYFAGYADLTHSDGMIHGNLNHAIAATGRLSSSQPNLQNAGHSPIRAHFKSRYKGGKLMEVDLSQIEVVVQAVLSQDKAMIQDIKDGVDFHSKRAAFAHNVPYEFVKEAVDNKAHPEHDKWKGIRKSAKIVSFQKAYGAGWRKISDTTGLTRDEVLAFMQAEDQNYPEVPKTQEQWITEVEKTTMLRDGRSCGVLRSPVHVEYRFFQDNFNGHFRYKPTTIKNYPIQGFSADILKIILAGLRREVAKYNSIFTKPQGTPPVLLVNTVHDSVILDVPKDANVLVLAQHMVEVFTTEPITVLRDVFGFDFNAPISTDVEVGDNWFNMEEVGI